MNTNSNNLNESGSPYLLQHANNPVHWQAYKGNLIANPNNNKLLLISIGYSACHWCHVMEHESFEDQEVAQIMNDNFINIKVDREEHPHVDKVYMQACRLMTGGGGWPLNVVCTPDGTPIHAGTYFSKDKWINMLETISKLWKENPKQIEDFKKKLNKVLIEDNERQKSELNINLLANALESQSKLLDYNHGGLMGNPKFPMPVLLSNLVEWSVIFGNENWAQFVNLSLLKMIKGGMWDLVEGGFCRYSVDEEWFVPHFEKMLYDNALLLPLYFSAGKRVNLPILSEIGDKLVAFCISDLLQSNGLYAVALDADTLEGEGYYYAVSLEECALVLTKEELNFCVDYMGFTKEGNWEKGLNIPVISKPPQLILQELKIEPSGLEALQNGIFYKLKDLRKSKIKPALDYKCLCSWNGLMLSGLAKAAKHNLKYLKNAKDLASAMLSFMQEGIMHHQFSKDRFEIEAYLDDFAFYIRGLLDLWQTTQEDAYANKALELSGLVIDHFLAEDGTLLFQNKKEQLFTSVPDWEDNVVPSAIGTMCLNLLALGNLFGKPEYEQIASFNLSKVESAILKHTFWHSQWASIWLLKKAGNPVLVCSNTKAYEFFEKEVLEFVPESVLVVNAQECGLPIALGKQGEALQYYVCLNQTCLAPLNQPGQVLEIIRDYFGYMNI